ncbi:MAG: LysR family transcriptional regulator [Pseudomonadota bacterium]
MADRFEDLRVFLQVVESQSISGAADALDVAPSAVSRRLKDLEGRLGVQLILRTTRQMSLTDEGRQFHERARRIMADLEEAEQLAAADNCSLSGTLRISVPLTFGNMELVPKITQFMADQEDLVLDLQLDDRRVDLVEEGFDAAVRVGNLDDSSLIARKLATSRLVVCAAPSFLKKYGPIDNPKTINAIPGVHYSNSKNSSGHWECTWEGQKITVRPVTRLRASDGTALMAAAVAGLGIMRAPDFIVREKLANGELVEVLGGVDWGTFPINILYPQNKHMPRRLRAFIDHLTGVVTPSNRGCGEVAKGKGA